MNFNKIPIGDEQLAGTEQIKPYWVDFECWKVYATSRGEAEKVALERVKNGEVPEICNIEETGDDEADYADDITDPEYPEFPCGSEYDETNVLCDNCDNYQRCRVTLETYLRAKAFYSKTISEK